MAEKQYLTVSEAADLLGVSIRTMQLWIAQGKFHAFKLNPDSTRNSPYRVPAQEVAAFATRQQSNRVDA